MTGKPFLVNRRMLLESGCMLLTGAMMPRVFADAAGGVNIGMRAFTAIFPGGDGIFQTEVFGALNYSSP